MMNFGNYSHFHSNYKVNIKWFDKNEPNTTTKYNIVHDYTNCAMTITSSRYRSW